MKKILKYDSIIAFTIFVFMLAIPTFCRSLYVGDELWTFTNIYKMYNGYMIYKDCNVITTPLFFYIGKLIFVIFSPNMLVYRFYNLIINVLIYFGIYELYKTLGITKRKSLLYTLILLIFTSGLNNYGANYNNLVYVFVICGIICNIKQKNNLLKGLFLFLVLMTKQNVGVYYFAGLCLYYLWDRKNLKTNIKCLVTQGIVAFICFAVYCIYLYCNGTLAYFYDMAFCSLSEFSIKNLHFATAQSICIIIIQIMILSFAGFSAISKKINVSNDIKNNIKFILCMAMPLCAVEFPIFNNAHLVYGLFFCIVCLILILDKLIISEIVTKNKLINISIVGVVLLLSFINIYSFIFRNMLENKCIQHNYEPYYGVKMEKEVNNILEFTYNYIKENEKNDINTLVVSCDAPLTMNILKKSNYKFDLPFYGNLGSKGIQGLIDELKELKRTHIIINKKGPKIQDTQEVWDFINNNFERISEWNDYYYIYKTLDL